VVLTGVGTALPQMSHPMCRADTGQDHFRALPEMTKEGQFKAPLTDMDMEDASETPIIQCIYLLL